MPRCQLCDKGTNVAKRLSWRSSQLAKKTLKKQKPNLKRVKVVIDGETYHINACTRCIRSGFVNCE